MWAPVMFDSGSLDLHEAKGRKERAVIFERDRVLGASETEEHEQWAILGLDRVAKPLTHAMSVAQTLRPEHRPDREETA